MRMRAKFVKMNFQKFRTLCEVAATIWMTMTTGVTTTTAPNDADTTVESL
jgi:hypothetical protein